MTKSIHTGLGREKLVLHADFWKSTYGGVRVRSVSSIKTIERHKRYFTSQAETVHLLQDACAGSIVVHNVVEQPAEKHSGTRHTAKQPAINA